MPVQFVLFKQSPLRKIRLAERWKRKQCIGRQQVQLTTDGIRRSGLRFIHCFPCCLNCAPTVSSGLQDDWRKGWGFEMVSFREIDAPLGHMRFSCLKSARLTERTRLHLMHWMLRRELGHLLHPNISFEQEAKIVDVACGNW